MDTVKNLTAKQSEKQTGRQSNIELLRILAVMGVIILHYNNPICGGGLVHSVGNTINNWILYFLESLFICAVDLFLIISGYFMCTSAKRDLWKPIKLIIQLIVFRIGLYLLSVVFGKTVFSLKDFALSFIPVNYFVILYCVLYIISPYIGVAVNSLSRKNLNKMLIIIFALFSVYPIGANVISFAVKQDLSGLSSIGLLGDQDGYTIVNFILCWIIGAYIRKTNFTISKTKCFAVYFILTIFNFILNKRGLMLISMSYCSPIIILQSAAVFLLFNQIDIGSKRLINGLAKGVFSVFLLNSGLLSYISVERVTSGNTFVMLAHIALTVICIYLISWCVHYIYDGLMSFVWAFLKKHVPMYKIGIEE